MKKIIVSLLALMFVLVGCGAKLMTYSSDDLGLTFDYLSKSHGAEVILEEDGEVVSLMTGDNVIATLSVEMIDSLTGEEGMINHLWKALLDESEACEIEEVSVTEEKEVYGFNSTVYPYGDEFDPNCRLTSAIYYFPAQVNKVVVVGTGQAPAYEGEDAQAFLDSIKLLP